MKRTAYLLLLRALAISLGAATLFAEFDTEYWFFELFAHFTVQYIVLSGLLFPLAVFLRLWKTATILACVFIIHAQEIHKVAVEYSQERVPCHGQTINILQSNVYYRNWRINSAAQALEKAAEKADIVIFNEFAEEWRAREEGRFKQLFPHGYITWINGNIEKIAIFSRQPFTVQQRSGHADKNAHLRLIFPNLGLTLYTYHGFTPISAGWVRERDREILRISTEMKRLHSPAVLTGDFNQTPYASSFQEALQAGNLKLAPFPQGVRPTWPDGLATAPLEIPIDHMLVNANVRFCKRIVYDIPGSDHGAVLNVLQLLPEVPDFTKPAPALP